MMACDVCGRVGETQEVSELLRLKGKLEAICPGCAKKANDMLHRLRSAAWNRVRKKLLIKQKNNRSKGGQ